MKRILAGILFVSLAGVLCERMSRAAEGGARFSKLPTEAWSSVIPAEKNLPPEWEKMLFERGAPDTYEGDALMKIGMPVGGICSGLVYLGGDGKLWWWDIFNVNHSGVKPRLVQYKNLSWHGLPKGINVWQGGNYVEPVTSQPCPFQQGFAIKVTEEGKSQTRTLDCKGWKNVLFTGTYPVGTVKYSDPACPVKITLEAYSPYCPLNFKDSSYPATIMRYKVENTAEKEVKVDIGGWFENAVLVGSEKGYPGASRTNSLTVRPGLAMLGCSALVDDQSVKTNGGWGTMAIAAIGSSASGGSAQLNGSPENAVFENDGPAGAVVPLDKSLLGGVRHSLTIPPAKVLEAEFVVAWHFANVWANILEKVKGNATGWHYVNRFNNATAVVEHIAANEKRLTDATMLWRDTWYNDSTLPFWFLTRVYITLDSLATPVCFRFADGRFYSYEGVRSCGGHPNHVWHYAQGHARVFPELEQDVLERVWYGFGFHEDGSMAYRGDIAGQSAIDGHCGVILCVLRAHQTNPDNEMLKRIWPRVKKSIEYAIAKDRDNDGLLDTPMLTTLDEPWHGQIPWISSLYISALKAGEVIATDMGDAKFAEECRTRAEKGRIAMDAKLFNGEWFIQTPDPENPTKLGAYETCHIDQVMGQGWAWQVGLRRVLSADTTLSALKSLWKYNFARNLDAYQKQADPKGRPYFGEGEGGLVMTANALGRKVPFGVHSGFACYLNETMCGFEYQAAAHMIAEGLVKEGFAVIRAIHERYDGKKRNPFNEVECGDHYARSMASYGALIAVSGFECHGPNGYIGFAPRLTPENFKAPFTAAEGWGTYEQRIMNIEGRMPNEEARDQKSPVLCQEATQGKKVRSQIKVKYGKLRLKTVSLGLPSDAKPGSVKVSLNEKVVDATLKIEDGKAVVTLASDLVINAGESLAIEL